MIFNYFQHCSLHTYFIFSLRYKDILHSIFKNSYKKPQTFFLYYGLTVFFLVQLTVRQMTAVNSTKDWVPHIYDYISHNMTGTC